MEEQTVTAVSAVQGAPPATVRAMRDTLIVLLAQSGMRHRVIVALRTGDVEAGPVWRVGPIQLTCAADARACPRCLLTVWLQVLPPLAGGFRASAREALARWNEAQRRVPAVHACEAGPGDTWLSGNLVLLPPIDRHGWAGCGPLSRRSIIRVLSMPLAELDAGHIGMPDGQGRSPSRFARPVRDDLYAALGDVDEGIEALTQRAATLMAELDAISAIIDTASRPARA